MPAKILVWFIATCAGAIFYRLGGAEAYNTKFRDLGVPLVSTAYLLTLGLQPHVGGLWGLISAYFLHFSLLFSATTSYFKRKGQDARWYNWALTGLAYSLAALPLAWATGNWVGFALRCVVTTVLVTLLSERIGWDVGEECSRGAVTVGTLPLLIL